MDYSACLFKVESADDLKSLAIHIVHIVNYFFFDVSVPSVINPSFKIDY